jgi:hypothetical protein
MNTIIIVITIAVLCFLARLNAVIKHNKRSNRAKMRIRLTDGKYARKVIVKEYGKSSDYFYL